MMESVYFSPEFLETLKRQMAVSDKTMHKIMNPFCGECLEQRRRKFLEELDANGQ